MTRAALWTKHRPIALAIAVDWRIPHHDPDDIRQEALVALWEATGSYDKTRGTFPAWARLVIKAHLRDLLQAATRQKRTCELVRDTDVPDTLADQRADARLRLFELVADPGEVAQATRRQAWRDAKRRQRAA